MSDVPPGGADPDGSLDAEPEVRRSTFSPPPASDDSYDDDALADALAAQVAAYTSPIPLPVRAASTSDSPAAVDPASAAEIRPEPSAPAAWPTAESPRSDFDAGAEAEGETPPATVFDLGEVSTLEAIERLERELRRRASDSQPVPLVAPDPDRIFPSPYRPFAPAPSGAEPPAGPLAADPEAAPAPQTPPPLVEPSAGGATLGGAVAAPPPIDFSQLPPPVGLSPAPIPPYAPDATAVGLPVGDAAHPASPAGSSVAPSRFAPPEGADDFESLLGIAVPAPATSPGLDVDRELDDDVDEVDRAFPAPIAVDPAGVAGAPYPPSEPIPTVRLADDEPALVDEVPEVHPAFEVESAGAEATALDLRAGRAARLFWLWFAANSSIVSLAIGATLFQLGMSLRQAIVATLAGVAISFLPLGLGTLAGKWSGQPTMIVSRATFGVVGNIIPALLALVSRIFWGGALLWLLAASIARVLVSSGLDAGLGADVWTLAGLVGGFVIATIIAVFGYGFVARLQLVLSIVSGLLIAGAAVLTYPRVDLSAALTIGDGPWVLVAGGAVVVFSFLGLAWVHSSADLARYQRPASSGATSMLWATFGATLPAFLLIGWGAVLAASDPDLAAGLAEAPLATLATLLPAWYPAPLLAAAGLGLLSGAVLTIYSGGFALQSLGVRARRSVTTALAAVLVLAAAGALAFLVPDARTLLREVATTLAVPVAAWAGIFAAEMMVRSRPFSASGLLARGGVYADVRWVNLLGLLVISAAGFGFTTAAIPGLDWQGFLLTALGIPLDSPLAVSDLGVFVALGLGLLLPLVTGVRAVRRQERAGTAAPGRS